MDETLLGKLAFRLFLDKTKLTERKEKDPDWLRPLTFTKGQQRSNFEIMTFEKLFTAEFTNFKITFNITSIVRVVFLGNGVSDLS